MILDKLERGVCFEGTDILIPWYTPMPSLKHYGNPEVIDKMSDRVVFMWKDKTLLESMSGWWSAYYYTFESEALFKSISLSYVGDSESIDAYCKHKEYLLSKLGPPNRQSEVGNEREVKWINNEGVYVYLILFEMHVLRCNLTIGINQQAIEKTSLKIGDTYAGGIVFYLDPGSECHGLVCAPYDQAKETDWEGAATFCKSLRLGGYSDWRLPSKDELYRMYMNLHTAGLGGFVKDYYWSSTEGASSNAWVAVLANGFSYVFSKRSAWRVRAVRSFGPTGITCLPDTCMRVRAVRSFGPTPKVVTREQQSCKLKIGDTYAGGIVFYLDTGGDCHGLVCAPYDQSPKIEWADAADLCRSLRLGNYADWRLPSRDELNQMYTNLHKAGLGGFANDWYCGFSDIDPGRRWPESINFGML
jgi:hypothetical protein